MGPLSGSSTTKKALLDLLAKSRTQTLTCFEEFSDGLDNHTFFQDQVTIQRCFTGLDDREAVLRVIVKLKPLE